MPLGSVVAVCQAHTGATRSGYSGFVSCFECFGTCFSGDERLQEDVNLRVVERQTAFGVTKKMCNPRSVNIGVKSWLLEVD